MQPSNKYIFAHENFFHVHCIFRRFTLASSWDRFGPNWKPVGVFQLEASIGNRRGFHSEKVFADLNFDFRKTLGATLYSTANDGLFLNNYSFCFFEARRCRRQGSKRQPKLYDWFCKLFLLNPVFGQPHFAQTDSSFECTTTAFAAIRGTC